MKFIVVTISMIAIIIASSDATCPKIITRSEWGARPATTSPLPTRPAPWYLIHHTAGSSCTTEEKCAQQMRSIQNFHIDGNKWDDIGYNFCVGEDGNIYEGRGWDRQGAHAPVYNAKSIGICILGTFINELPAINALEATKALINCGVSLGHVRSDYGLIGHRQASQTECPGTALFKEIKTWNGFVSNP